jgi:hypothetical protein
MNIPWGSVISLISRIGGAITIGVPSVEAISRIRRGLSGADKKTAVLELVQQELTAVETAAGRDLAHDAAVLAAAGAIVDAYVAFANLLAQKATAATP